MGDLPLFDNHKRRKLWNKHSFRNVSVHPLKIHSSHRFSTREHSSSMGRSIWMGMPAGVDPRFMTLLGNCVEMSEHQATSRFCKRANGDFGRAGRLDLPRD